MGSFVYIGLLKGFYKAPITVRSDGRNKPPLPRSVAELAQADDAGYNPDPRKDLNR